MTTIGATPGSRTSSAVDPRVFTAALTGEIDLDRKAELDAVVRAFDTSTAPTAHIDFAGAAFIDSSGLGALVQIHVLARARGGEVVLVRPSEPLLRILRAVGLEKMFPVQP